MTTKIIMTDGTKHETLWRAKSINPYTDETPGVWTPDRANSAGAKSARLVPSVFAGVNARMQAMGDLPFTVYSVKGDKPLDDSDNYKNVVRFLPYPSRHFMLTEGALSVAGCSYWFTGRGEITGAVKGLQYWIPSSVTLDAKSAEKGEIRFQRAGQSQLFEAQQVLYTWLLDPDIELGPPTVYPLLSALVAAQANGAITGWVRDYMLRGAVKAMLLMVDGMPPPSEVERMESWFNKFMSGAKGLLWKVFNATGVKPTIVGDGLEALKDLSINKELRYEIHQALGTRHLLEDENFATASARERQFYTISIMPDARLIQANFNEQILHKAGYHLEFEPNRLEIFQTDEAERAGSLSQLYNVLSGALSPNKALELSMEILGYNLTQEQEKMLVDGIQEKKDNTPPPVPEQGTPPVPATPNKALIELDRWEDKCTKAKKIVTWHAVDLPSEIVKSVKDGKLTFEQARAELTEPRPTEAAVILEAIRLELQAMK